MKKRRPGSGKKTPLAAVVSLGCAKNLVDTEYLMGEAVRAGWGFTSEWDAADLLLVNTCSFLRASVEESRGVIEEARRWKGRRRGRRIVAAGCLVSLREERLEERFPGVDLFLSPGQIPRFAAWLAAASPPVRLPGGGPAFLPGPAAVRVGTTGPWAYLKISDGCDNRCRYCRIPAIRGPHRSRGRRAILREARDLVTGGVREIDVVGQDITRWGQGQNGGGLAALVRSLAALEGDFRLRLLYLHPARVDGELVSVVAEEPRVWPYLDLPVQHASSRVLAAMGRPYDGSHLRRLYDRLREGIPGVALRTTVIVGYPGETTREFRGLLRFLRERPFENLGAFCYSPEPETAAAALGGRPREETARRRLDELMAQQRELAASLWRARRGTVTEALVTGRDPGDPSRLVGRTAWQAPEVDGEITLEGDALPGKIVRVRITGSGDYDLKGTIEAES